MPDLPDVRLHVGDDVMALCQLAGRELGEANPPLPYWAFPWAGGLAVARLLVDHPGEVVGKDVLDMASGSGVCAIVAARAGAAAVEAIDVDRLAEAAVAVNARANGVRIAFRRRDILDEPPPAVDVILAGDICYEETMAARMLTWLRVGADHGTRVLIGDPGRTYLPAGLERVATYPVRTSLELENAPIKQAAVFTIPVG